MNKRIIFVALFVMSLFTLNAQRAAVMEFKAGAGISQADVDGISGIFTTYFRPSGYTMVERTQIDRVIEEQRFQRSSLTESQMVRIGEILNISKIVIGDINVVMGQYNVDVRVINVESGTIAATEGATFSGSSYRTSMQNVAQKLASKIAIGAGPTVSGGSSSANPTPKSRTQVETVYGYLHVFPNELGVFQSEPTTVINQINTQGMHGYPNWRIPTNEELALLRANGYLRGSQYMTKEAKSGMVLLVSTGKSIAELSGTENGHKWVDLGLSVKWATCNVGATKPEEYGNYYAWGETSPKSSYTSSNYTYSSNPTTLPLNRDAVAVNWGGNWRMPTLNEIKELKEKCKWTWTGRGYTVTGPNGNSIFLPAAGCRGNSDLLNAGSVGYYWSSSLDADYSFRVNILHFFNSGNVYWNETDRCCGQSVRGVFSH